MTSLVTTPNQAYALAVETRLPPSLDGSNGANRNHEGGRRQIAANTDWDAVRLWLSQFTDKPKTYASYEKEVLRFYVWALSSRGKPLSSLVFEDWAAYLAFLEDPQPRSVWVGTKRGRRNKDGSLSRDYRPFAGALSASSIRYAHGIVWSMFEWLYSTGYLAGNPIILSRRRLRRPKRKAERFLDESQWQAVLDAIARLPSGTKVEKQHRARWRWMATLFYMTGVRTAEAVNGVMGDFSMVFDRVTSRNRYFLDVVGKGDKQRAIPISDSFLSELADFRQTFGLAPWPAPNEQTPLLFSLRSKTGYRALTRQSVWAQFKGLFKHAAEELRRSDANAADRLLEASTHWIRHTAATDMLNAGVDLLNVKAMLGHEDIQTTMLYSHAEDVKVHRDVTEKHQMRKRPAQV